MTISGPKRRSTPVPESMSATGLWAFESRHDEKFFMSPTRHAFPKLLYIREGTGAISGNWPTNDAGSPMNCKSGECVLIPAGLSHRVIDDPDRPISLYGLAVDPRRVATQADLNSLLPIGKLPTEQVAFVGVARRMRRLLYLAGQDRGAANLAALAGALDLLAQLAMAAEASPLRRAKTDANMDTRSAGAIEEYLSWLDSNFYESLTLDQSARTCGMSRRHFTATFRQRTGKTWLAYLNELRVAHAIMLLRESDSKVASIAFQSGFEDLSTFYRTVKRVSGKKPLDFRVGSDASE